MEMASLAARFALSSRKIASVWIGGGTPTMLATAELGEILDLVEEYFPEARASSELTLEGSPQTFSRPAIRDFVAARGIRRVSIGVESTDDRFLRMLGRGYSGASVLALLQELVSEGLEVNADVMYRLPGQTVSQAERDFLSVAESGVDHVSAFPLILKSGMNLVRRIEKGILPPRGGRDVYEAMFGTLARLSDAVAIPQYAYNYYSKSNRQSRYLVGRWGASQDEMLGLGPGALSYFAGAAYVNEVSLDRYVEVCGSGMLPIQRGKIVTAYEAMARYIILGLRFFSLDREHFYRKFGVDMVDLFPMKFRQLEEIGALQLTPEFVTVSEPARPYILQIGREFYTTENAGLSQPQYALLGFGKVSDGI